MNNECLLSILPLISDEYATVARTATLQLHPHPEVRQGAGTAHSLGGSDVYVNIRTEALLTAGGRTSHLDARMHAATTGVSLRMFKMEVERKLRSVDDEFSVKSGRNVVMRVDTLVVCNGAKNCFLRTKIIERETDFCKRNLVENYLNIDSLF